MATHAAPAPLEREYIAVEDGTDNAGAQTFWSLAGDTSRKDLEAASLVRGIQRMPTIIEPETALRRAAEVLRTITTGTSRCLIRPVRKGVWALVGEDVDLNKEALKYWQGPTVSLNMIGRPSLKNASAEEATAVVEAYDLALETLTTDDVSRWLLEAVSRLGGIALRRTGGIYYLPPSAMPTWRRHIEALTEVSPTSCVYVIPTVKMTSDAARAILDSLVTDVTEAADELTSEVLSGELGVRGLEFRAQKSGALLRKVSEYERIVGQRLEGLHAVIGKLDVDVAAAKLAAEAAADEES
jgi:hypothetical protein